MKKQKADKFQLTLEGHKPFKPRNRTQADFLRTLQTSEMTIAKGPAGTGKTYVASVWAIEELAAGRIDKIILSRPTITIDNEQIGFLPGTLEKKMEPWTAPIFDAFRERVGQERTLNFLKDGAIQIVPFAFMRGRTFKNAVVLIDEAQNMSIEQAKALVTRIGENARYIISGDVTQSDRQGTSGLQFLIAKIEARRLPVPVINFTSRDVVRSPLCRLWVEAIEG
ncbi:phosphate starvation protein PhoH [Terrihabitans soli]|uniref:Phosphate starvation protein PhoH n=1 Tax=Terrihabitans soli TaxID=708113 RepID=A0A6S6QXJ8_9HYPH|nr:PhoH family protein [Terrihabitans soli]BCJ91751.1 phosphate starvation protein PhoH [Terrihabitans soli]